MLGFWSTKGGVGCSTIASAVAMMACTPRSRRQTSRQLSEVLLVDLGGDLPAVLGIDAPPLGLADWLVEPYAAPDALTRIEANVAPGLQLLPLGSIARVETFSPSTNVEVDAGADSSDPAVSTQPNDRSRLLFRLLAADDRLVVVDIGKRTPAPVEPAGGMGLLQERACAYVANSVLVTRLCYLSLRATAEFETPNRIAVVAEPGRSLTVKDVEGTIGAPIATTVRWDAAIARAVDTGLVVTGVPRPLRVVSSLLEAGN